MGLFDGARKGIQKGMIRGIEKNLEDENNTMKKNVLNAEQTKKTTSEKQIGRNAVKKCVNCGKKFGNHIKVCPNCGSKDFAIEFDKEKVDKLWKEYEEEKKDNPDANMIENRFTRKEELAIMNNSIDKQYKLLSRIKIYREIPIVKKNKNPGTYIRPAGITDIIRGMNGDTAINKKITYTPATSTVGTKWVEDELLFNDTGFTISSSGETILYENISEVTVDKNTPTDNGFLVYIALKNSKDQLFRRNISFRTPKALDVKVLIKDKIANQNILDTSEETSTNNSEPITSNADELMKYAELYEKGLLTEEEFSALKKKLLGL